MGSKWVIKSVRFVDISGYPPKTPPRRRNGTTPEPKGNHDDQHWTSNLKKIVENSMENLIVAADSYCPEIFSDSFFRDSDSHEKKPHFVRIAFG